MADFPTSVKALDEIRSLQRALSKGNVTGGTNFVVSSSDFIQGQILTQGTLIHVRGGNSTSGGNSGANIRIEGGTGNGSGDGGAMLLRGGDPGGSGAIGYIQLTNNGEPDTLPVASLLSEGTNGATIFIFTGDREPNAASITSLSAGDLYYRDDGVTYRSTASGTGNWFSTIGIIRTFDNRSSPHRTPVAGTAGGTATGTIDVGTANGRMAFLFMESVDNSDTSDVEFFADSSKTLPIYTVLAHDFVANPLLDNTQTFLMADDGTDLESDSIYYTITNDDVVASTAYDISMIVEGE